MRDLTSLHHKIYRCLHNPLLTRCPAALLIARSLWLDTVRARLASSTETMQVPDPMHCVQVDTGGQGVYPQLPVSPTPPQPTPHTVGREACL